VTTSDQRQFRGGESELVGDAADFDPNEDEVGAIGVQLADPDDRAGHTVGELGTGHYNSLSPSGRDIAAELCDLVRVEPAVTSCRHAELLHSDRIRSRI
jgi:hypothetical protein